MRFLRCTTVMVLTVSSGLVLVSCGGLEDPTGSNEQPAFAAKRLVPASAATACVPPPLGMVAWWTGDGNTEDIQGSHHGTLAGDATYSNGMVAQAFSLDGRGDFVTIPDAPELRPATFTVDAWAKPASLRLGSWDSIISHGGSGKDPSFAGWWDSYWLGFYRGRPTFHTAHSGIGDHRLSATDLIPLDQWCHLAATYDGTTKKLYLDGVLVASATVTIPILYDANPVPVLIGEDTNNGQPANIAFDGLLDEVEIFNRALSVEEIAAITNAGSAGKCNDPQSKDDCKGGGWEQYGFKNQGQCVRFIETGKDSR